MALLPHIALLSQTVPNPCEVFEPHMAEDPHSADEPHIAEFEVTNCDGPHIAVFFHVAERFHTAVGSKLRNTFSALGS